ncbi:FAD-binding- type 2 [Apiospora arundinis]
MDNIQPLTYAIISIAFAIGFASFLGRWYSRALIIRSFGWDDVFSVILMLVNIMQQTILYLFLHYGCGKHVETLNPYQLEQITKWLFYEEIFYMFMHWSIKHTFLMFYLRLSPNHTFRRLVWATMVLNTAFMVVNWLLAFLQCIPMDAIFHPERHPDAKCINKSLLLMGPSVLNMISDVIILVLPIHTVMGLQMSPRRKFGVVSIMGFGASAVIVAACRFIVLHELGHDPDISFILGKMVIVAGIEVQCAVVAVNLPSMKALWSKVVGGTGYAKDSENSGAPSGGSYELSSPSNSKRKGGRGHWAGPIADVSITNQIATQRGTDSEEELCRKGTAQENIQVTSKADEIPGAGVDIGSTNSIMTRYAQQVSGGSFLSPGAFL